MTSKKSYFVHSSSYVDRGAKIGRGTRIWHFSHIMRGAIIGRNCRLGQNVVVHGRVQIGNNVKIQNNVSVYDGVLLEDDVFCGPSCVFTNVKNPRAAIARSDPEFIRPTRVQQGATIGANATIVCGVNIGRHAFVGAGAVVTKDVADYAVVLGVPARRVGWMCPCGERLRIVRGRAICSACGQTYRGGADGVQAQPGTSPPPGE